MVVLRIASYEVCRYTEFTEALSCQCNISRISIQSMTTSGTGRWTFATLATGTIYSTALQSGPRSSLVKVYGNETADFTYPGSTGHGRISGKWFELIPSRAPTALTTCGA